VFFISTRVTAQVAPGVRRLVSVCLRCTQIVVCAFFFAVPALLPVLAMADVQNKTEELADDARESGAMGRPQGNWVAVPVPVSNPTLGTGLQAVLMYLHPRSADDPSPNATSGLAAVYTNNDSWFVGAFHDDSWDQDRYRFTGFVGQGDLKLRFYGVGGDAALANSPVDYSLGVSVLFAQIQMRLPDTEHWFAGLRYVYMRSESVFNSGAVVPGLPPAEVSIPITTSGIGALLTYDSRDDNYYPTRGHYAQAVGTRFSDNLGGGFESEFDKAVGFYNYYHSVSPSTVLALRARLEATSENAPFFFLSTLNMRGFSRDRYLDNYTLSVHAEARHKLAPRWGVVAFTEAGRFADSFSGLADGRTIVSYGAGVRWQATADKSLNLALDAAVSTDDRAVYLTIGEAF
jgi:hypothetical protein